MMNAGTVDFLFTGLAVLPGSLLFTGHVGPALLLFIPLLVGACLFSMYQQQTAEPVAAPQSGAEAADAELKLSGSWREQL